jgi:hydroxymethylbilane synthase
LWEKLSVRTRILEVDEMIPAVGQGAIGLEIRTADAATRELVAAINNPNTFASVTAERAFLRAVGGGCQTPFAAHARIEGEELRLIAAKFSPDGKDVRKTVVRGAPAEAEQLGQEAAAHLCPAGGSDKVAGH